MKGSLSPYPPRRAAARTIALASALVLLLCAGAPARAHACAHADALPGAASSESIRRSTLCLLNRERTRRGLARLRPDRRLVVAARRHARDMVRRRYFAHDSLSGKPFTHRIHRTGYTTGRRWTLGENLAWGAGSLASPEAIVHAWMESPAHRANVVGPFREVGVGLALGSPRPGHTGAGTYATEFGRLRR